MFRDPTAFTSSSLPFLMCGSRLSPGDGIESAFVVVPPALAAVFSESVVVPGFVGSGLEGSVSPVFAVVVVVVVAGVVPVCGVVCAGVAVGELAPGALVVLLGCCAIADVTATNAEIVSKVKAVRVRMERLQASCSPARALQSGTARLPIVDAFSRIRITGWNVELHLRDKFNPHHVL
jgi:hypothetical protein